MKPRVLDELIEKISSVFPQDWSAVTADTQQNLRAMLLSFFEKMELVTRDEFEIQKKVLARAHTKIEELSQELERLKNKALGDA